MSVHEKLYVFSELFTPRVDGTDFTTEDWAYLGTVDQNLSKTDSVEFSSVVLNNGTHTTTVQSGATEDYLLTLPSSKGSAGEILQTDGSGVTSWVTYNAFNQQLDMSDSPTFTDLTLTGDLTVQGTTTMIDTVNMEVKDNVILLNSGETGSSVSSTTAGIEIDRGTGDNVLFVFDDVHDKWVVGQTGALGTDNFSLAEVADVVQTQGAMPGYDSNGRLAESAGLSAEEVSQLQNIDSTVITSDQWSHLGGLDQGVSTTDDVTFNDVNVSSLTSATPIAGSVSALLSSDPLPITDFINIFDASKGDVSITLPDNAANSGKTYILYLMYGGDNLIINGAGTDVVGSSSSITMNLDKQHIKLTSLGNGTWIIN